VQAMANKNRTAGKPSSGARISTTKPSPSPHGPGPNHLVIVSVACVLVAVSVLYFKPSSSPAVSISPSVIISSNKTSPLVYNLACNKDSFPRCVSSSTCGRYIQDDVLSAEEASTLLSMIHKVIQKAGGGGDGGPTIFDLATGALTFKDKFISLYEVLRELKKTNGNGYQPMWNVHEHELLVSTVNKVHSLVAKMFKVEMDEVYLAKPLFFSHIQANKEPKRMNDEYWHKHIDRIAYGSFDYTALIYLSDYDVDFEGGRFIFSNDGHVDEGNEDDDNGILKGTEDALVLEPIKGRMNAFTSGSENVHWVEKVTKGERYAITISFTCLKADSIPPNINEDIGELLVK